jgi:hypothetical protein
MSTRQAHRKFTIDQICEALQLSGGNVAGAARRLKADRQTIYNYTHRSRKVQQVLHNARETLVDDAEQGLAALVRNPKAQGHTAACIYVTKTLGKSRGWVEPHQVREAPAGELIIEAIILARQRAIAKRQAAQQALAAGEVIDITPSPSAGDPEPPSPSPEP